jgi:hypothetical protein
MDTSVFVYSPLKIKGFSTDFTGMGLVQAIKVNHVVLKLEFFTNVSPQLLQDLIWEDKLLCWGHMGFLQG